MADSNGLNYAVETDNSTLTRYLMYQNSTTLNKGLTNNLDMDAIRYIMGAPYQFMSSVDSRLMPTGVKNIDKNKQFGRKYYEKIISRMPLLMMSPGSPRFMPQISDKKKRTEAISTFLQAFKNIGGHDKSDESALDALLQEYTGKAYYIDLDYEEYYKYVNPMCRAGAFYLNIQDEVLFDDGTKLSEHGWHSNTNNDAFMNAHDNTAGMSNKSKDNSQKLFKKVQNYLYYKRCVPFYIESDSQISETFTNDTGESMLAGSVNGLSDSARELGFILGRGSVELGVDYESISAGYNDALDKLQNMVKDKEGRIPGILNNMSEIIKSITTGGRMIFPEIWNDSKFSRSYSVSMKLATPETDNISWYLNIYVPLCHLMAFVLPHQHTRLGYSSPFLVRAFYKGFFNIDMGIITDMTFNKGKDCGWTTSGLPTVVDVNFTIKDLYQELALTSFADMKFNMMANTSELDYIANMCGVNINAPDMERYISMYFALNLNPVTKIRDFLDLDVNSRLQSLAGDLFNNSWTNIIGRFQ